MMEPFSQSHEQGGLPGLGGGHAGGPAFGGGPNGQLESQALKCGIGTRHRLVSTAYFVANCWRSAVVILSAVSFDPVSTLPSPSTSRSAAPAVMLMILMMRPLGPASHRPRVRL